MRARLVGVGIGVAAMASLSGSSPASAATSAATVLDAGGCVREAPGAECKPASVGAVVGVQSAFVAGSSGNRLRLADGSELALAAEGEIVMQPSTKLDLGGKDGLRGQVVQIVRGQCDVTVATTKAAPSAVLLRGPLQLSAIAKSGSVVVRSGTDSLIVANVGGEALAASGNDWNEVPAGKVRVLTKADPKGALRDLPTTPQTKPSNRFSVSIGGASVAPLEIAWSAVPAATAYEVQVRREGGAEVARRRVADGATQSAFSDLGTGSFTARVRAVDADGLTTAWSSPVGLSSVGLVLPEGALVTRSGVIQLAPKQKVRLVGFEGMEIAVGAAWLSTPPEAFGLLTGKAQTVRVRRKGDVEEHALRFEPRSAMALVELSPKNVRWPGADVAIRVTLADRNGGPAPVGIKLVPRVVLDVTAIDVTWSEKDGVLVASVSPRDTDKPHVVRVEVADQFGVELGRGFVEVAVATPAKSR